MKKYYTQKDRTKWHAMAYQNGELVAEKWFPEADKYKALAWAGVSNFPPSEYCCEVKEVRI